MYLARLEPPETTFFFIFYIDVLITVNTLTNMLTNMAKCVQEVQWFLFRDVFDVVFAQPTGPAQLKSLKTQLLK